MSCRFKVELIFKGARFHKRNQYLQSSVCLRYNFEEFRYYWDAKYSKTILKQINTTFFIYGVLSLSNQCECVCTKIASIAEERISRNQRINPICILLQQNSDKNIVTECQNSFDYNFNLKFVVHKIVKVMMSR